MPRKVLMIVSALPFCLAVLPIPAFAAPPPSSEQLVCDLTGQCGTSDAAEPTQDKPGTRGFSIARVGAPAAAAARPAALTVPSASSSRPRAVHMAAAAASPAVGRGALVPRSQVGHAQLSLDFVSGSTALSDADKSQSDSFLVALKNPALSGKHFLISGHTSAVGSRASNLDLSQRRAQALVDYLVAKGADRGQFDVKGFGFDQPLPGTKPASPTNRRVDVTIVN